MIQGLKPKEYPLNDAIFMSLHADKTVVEPVKLLASCKKLRLKTYIYPAYIKRYIKS
jgi:hypothetical protein